MPRTVSIRRNYQGDVARLARLGDAIDKDPKRDDKWKDQAQAALNTLIRVLLEPVPSERKSSRFASVE